MLYLCLLTHRWLNEVGLPAALDISRHWVCLHHWGSHIGLQWGSVVCVCVRVCGGRVRQGLSGWSEGGREG